ncbi:MAG TPA: hypothetical protein V6C76_14960 [Drouetiella sp.]
MKRSQGKGKANDISGIPLPGTLAQIEGQSIEPNRDEPPGAFKTETPENDRRNYFDDEEERLGNLETPFVANKADDQWSEGLEDEENEFDDRSDDGLFPETQPLHVSQSPEGGADDSEDMVLRPTQIDDDVA